MSVNVCVSSKVSRKSEHLSSLGNLLFFYWSFIGIEVSVAILTQRDTDTSIGDCGKIFTNVFTIKTNFYIFDFNCSHKSILLPKSVQTEAGIRHVFIFQSKVKHLF